MYIYIYIYHIFDYQMAFTRPLWERPPPSSSGFTADSPPLFLALATVRAPLSSLSSSGPCADPAEGSHTPPSPCPAGATSQAPLRAKHLSNM